MSKKISPIIQVKELFESYENENLVIVDVSNRESYNQKHIDKAIFIDLNSQLADIKENLADGGRHPLPEIEEFAQTLGNNGITEKSHIVIYDDKDGANASARFWWMLRAIGHEKVQVLNGGLQHAEKMGIPVNNRLETPKAAETYKPDNWKLSFADIKEVEDSSQREDHIVIDVREESRYRGESEPIDLVAGHIPGAINVPYMRNLGSEGLFLSPNELKSKYQEIFNDIKSENIIVHCGSGVTACHTLLAIDYAGLEIPKLYVGSWSEWSRNNKSIATEI